MSLFTEWEFLKREFPPSKTPLFFNSQRRYISCQAYKYDSLLFSLKECVRYLIRNDEYPPTYDFDYIVSFEGDLKDMINAGKMIQRVLSGDLENSFQVISEKSLLEHKKIEIDVFPLRFLHFLKEVFINLPFFIKLLACKKINLKQFFAYLLHKNAFGCFLNSLISKPCFKFFITYNDYLGISPEITIAFIKNKKNVYHIQHGILSEINYPGCSSKFILWGKNSYEKAIKLGYKEESLEIVGAACFLANKSSGLGEKNRLLFFSQTNLIEHTGLKYCLEVKNWLKQFAEDFSNWEVVIRLHPHERDNNFYSDLFENKNVIFENKNSIEDAISQAKVCCTIWSGSALDVLIAGSPLIILKPFDFEKNIQFVKDGCAYAENYDQLSNLIADITSGIKNFQNQENALKKEIEIIHAEKEIAQYIITNEN